MKIARRRMKKMRGRINSPADWMKIMRRRMNE